MRRIPLVSVTIAILLLSSLSEARQNWIEVRSPHFLVITNAGERRGRDTALHLERIRAFFRQSLAVAGYHPSPFVTVLAVKDAQTMRDILEQYWGQRQPHIAGVFSQRLDQYFAVVELDIQRSGYYSTFYHEYYHSITVPAFPDLPVWLAEGLAEFYGRTDIGDDYVGTGRPDRDLLEVLRETKLIPLEVLFRVDHSSPYYNESNKVSIFYAESWLATHYLMIGSPEAHKLLVRYLEALGQGESWSEATAAFGDLKKLQADLSGYLRQKKFLYLNSSPPKVDVGEFKVRTLSEAEAEAYLGGVSVGLGHTQHALHTLTKAVELDPNLSLAYEYLGMAQFLDGQQSKALESASRSVKLGSSNSSARYLRAYYTTHGRAMLSTDAQVEEDLRQAIILSPEFSPAYALLGLYLASQAHRSDEGLSLVKQALSLDPSNSSYQLTLARVLFQMKRYDEAEAAATRANALARDQGERLQVQQFASQLDAERLPNQVSHP
jgi:tetratricopeptide (TPR) repeat protein